MKEAASTETASSSSRGERIRTSDPLHPMQVRYRAALHPEMGGEGKQIHNTSIMASTYA